MTHHYKATPPKHVDWKRNKAHKYAYSSLIGKYCASRTNFRQSLDTPTLPFLHNFECNFIRMDTVNLTAKFEVRSFTRSWDNWGYLKTLGSSWILPRCLFSLILMGFCSDGRCETVNLQAKFEIRSFTRSWDNSGYLKNFGQSLDTPTLFFLHNFECGFFQMDTEFNGQIWSPQLLPLPEIIVRT